ncbi:hypothetical protein [Homoserinimonas aerilata]|nr:hypothetical protein [Homoserinimonas aerilata]
MEETVTPFHAGKNQPLGPIFLTVGRALFGLITLYLDLDLETGRNVG